jgi:perosamine synthetase
MFWNTEVAYKYKMTSMQAALGLAQLERIDELIERKRQIFDWYQEKLGNIEGIILNYEAPNTKNTYWMVTVILDEKFGLKKETLMALISEKSIDCRPFFYPLSSLPAYQNLEQTKQAQQRNKNAYKISPYGLNLPSGMNMTEEKVDYVCDVLKTILGIT